MWQESCLVLHTPCRTLQESHSLDCSSQHFYTVTTWYTVFPSTIVSDIHNGPRVGNLTQLSPLKGEKTWEWAMSIGKSKYALVGFQISWVVSPGFHKQNFPGFQIPLRWGGSFPHTHQTEWSIENITCIITKGVLSLNFEETHLHKTSFLPKFAIYLHFFTTCTCSCYPAKSFSIQQCLKLMVIHSSKRVKLAKKRVKLWVSCSHGWVEV